MSKIVLVVVSHPDEEVLGCGGSIARHTAKGDDVPKLLSGLKEYFKFYNFERPHQSLVGNTPAEIYWGREVARKAA